MDGWMILLSGLGTAVVSILGARIAGRASVKVKELDVDGQAYIRAQGINEEIVTALREQIKDLSDRLGSVEREVREVREHNNALTRYCYRLIDILRSLGHGDKIPTPPPTGIHL